jgi:hypothetical protein
MSRYFVGKDFFSTIIFKNFGGKKNVFYFRAKKICKNWENCVEMNGRSGEKLNFGTPKVKFFK